MNDFAIFLYIALPVCLLIGSSTYIYYFVRNICPKCEGKGYTLERGERIPRNELSASQWADEMVNGGFTYRAVKVDCKRCHGSKKWRNK